MAEVIVHVVKMTMNMFFTPVMEIFDTTVYVFRHAVFVCVYLWAVALLLYYIKQFPIYRSTLQHRQLLLLL